MGSRFVAGKKGKHRQKKEKDKHIHHNQYQQHGKAPKNPGESAPIKIAEPYPYGTGS